MDFTKLQICKTAKELFNQNGYRSVSMRQIAQAANISLGTLTYHYARKQDLLAAIMESTIRTFPNDPPQNIPDFQKFLKQLLESIADSPFYFNDPSLYRSIPLIQNQDYANVGYLFNLFEAALAGLVKSGRFSSSLTHTQIHQLSIVLLLSHTGWSQYNASRSGSLTIDLGEILAAQWTVLYPYLTPLGLDEYKKAVAL